MRLKNYYFFLFAATCFLSSQSFARAFSRGGIAGGGGVGFVCTEQGQEVVHVADIYDLVQAGALNKFSQDANTGSSAFLEWATGKLEAKFPEKIFAHPFVVGEQISFGTLLSHTSAILVWQLLDPVNDMQEFKDDNIAALDVPAQCRKVQLAVQNLQTGVITRSHWTSKLSKTKWSYLVLHEALIRIRNQPLADTTPIRGQVREIAQFLANSQSSLREMILQNDILDTNNNLKSQMDAPLRLREIPSVLDCKVTSFSTTIGDAPPLSRFQIVRTEGFGLPGTDAKYELRTGLESQGSVFQNIWNPRHNSFSEFQHTSQSGSRAQEVIFDFSANFAVNDVNFELKLDRLYSRTHDFLGHVTIRKPFTVKVFGPTPDMTINCYAPTVNVGR